MVIEEIRSIRSGRRDLRNFGLVVGGVFALIGLLLLWRGRSAWPYFCGGGSVLVISGFLFPGILRPLQRAWMTLALLMGWVVTRIILTLLFFLVLTPIGLAAKAAGRSFLDHPSSSGAESYWNIRRGETRAKGDYEKQF